MGYVLPHDSANDRTPDEEFSGRGAFDRWRFMQADRIIPWDWADMGAVEKRHWIDRGKQTASRVERRYPPGKFAAPLGVAPQPTQGCR